MPQHPPHQSLVSLSLLGFYAPLDGSSIYGHAIKPMWLVLSACCSLHNSALLKEG